MTAPTTHPRRWMWTFFPIWIGQIFSIIGSQVAQFALVWWLTSSTGSATVLMTATLVAVVPGVLIGPFAGALVDRWNRRLTMIIADLIGALAALALALLFWGGTLEIWHVYLAMFVRAICAAFHVPAEQASIALMVPKAQLARVGGLNQMLQGATMIAGPPLGALVLSLLPLYSVMLLDVVTALIAIVPLLFVRLAQPPRDTTHAATGDLWTDLREGLRYVARWRGLLVLLAISAALNFLFAPAFALLPLLVTGHFAGGAFALGWLSAAWSVGLLGGGLLLSTWGGFPRKIVTALTALIVMGVFILVIGITPPNGFWIAFGAFIISGVCNGLANGALMALLQSVIVPEMQARVFTLIGSASTAMMPLGLLIAGPLAERYSVQIWFALAGAMCIVMGGAAFRSRSVMQIEDHAPQQDAVTPVSG